MERHTLNYPAWVWRLRSLSISFHVSSADVNLIYDSGSLRDMSIVHIITRFCTSQALYTRSGLQCSIKDDAVVSH